MGRSLEIYKEYNTIVYINNMVALQEPSPAEEPSSKTGRGSIPKAAVPKAEKGRGTKPKKAAPAQPAGKTAAKQEEPAGKTAAKQEEQGVQAEEVPAGKPAAKQGKQAVKAQVPAAVPAAKPAVVKPPPWRQAAAVQGSGADFVRTGRPDLPGRPLHGGVKKKGVSCGRLVCDGGPLSSLHAGFARLPTAGL